MKNKKIICGGLLIAIFVLIAILGSYSAFKISRSNYDSGAKEPDGEPSSEENSSRVLQVDSFSTYNKLINNEDGMFIVFGKENCDFCASYKPVLEDLAMNYKLDIAYVNMSKLSTSDYQNVMNSDIVIPGKCNKEGVDIKLKSGFGTPLGLFIRKGETYDCIRGYNDYPTMEILMKTVGYIK